MFKRKCSQCKNNVKKDFEFCPFCGKMMKSRFDNQDYGFLGKNDFIGEQGIDFGSSFIDKIFNSAMKEIPSIIKNIERQMNENEPVSRPVGNFNIQFFVNGKNVNPEIRETRGDIEPRRNIESIKISNKFSKEKMNRLATLPRIEPESKVKRISGKLIYELTVPGVNNIEDVFINQLENSIEIKAISDKSIYSKTLNIKLPILGYNLEQGSLFLELQGR